jgi:hypothetical protein
MTFPASAKLVLADGAAGIETIPRNRLVWPAERLREACVDFRERDRPAGLIWALTGLIDRGEEVPERELAWILDHEDPEVPWQFFWNVPWDNPGDRFKQLARVLAARAANRPPADLDDATIRAFASHRPEEHLDALHAALTSGNPAAADGSIIALAAAARPESEPHLLSAARAARRFEPALAALSALLALGGEAAVKEATRRVLTLLHSAGRSSEVDFVHAGRYADSIGIGYLRLLSVDHMLFGFSDGDEEESWTDDRPFADDGGCREEDPLALFLPREDPAAARRAAAVLSGERLSRLRKLIAGGTPAKLVSFFASAATDAIALAVADNPAFADLGSRLAVFIRESSAPRWIATMPHWLRESLATLHGGLLAKAIRGRQPALEWQGASGDPERLVEFLRVDEDWLTETSFLHLAEHVPAAELVSLAESPDGSVRKNARFLLAAQDPARHLARALEVYSCRGSYDHSLYTMVMRAGGDDFLDAWVAMLTPQRWDEMRLFLGEALQGTGTERARWIFERLSEEAVASIEADEYLETSTRLSSPEHADRVFEQLVTGRLSLTLLPDEELDTEPLLEAIETFIDVVGRAEDPEEVLDRSVAAYAARRGITPEEVCAEDDGEEAFQQEEEEVPDVAEEREGDEPEGLSPEAPSDDSLPAGKTIVRDEPKVGRNDPCPCGSGRKHKRCCGR